MNPIVLSYIRGGMLIAMFFNLLGIPKGNKIEVYLLTSAENLYEYLAEESEGFSLIARKELLTN